jgi:hypothetical protein
MLGGMGLRIGPIGLHLFWKHDPAMQDEQHLGMDADSLATSLTTSRKSEGPDHRAHISSGLTS